MDLAIVAEIAKVTFISRHVEYRVERGTIDGLALYSAKELQIGLGGGAI
jgi:hypothetical protein